MNHIASATIEETYTGAATNILRFRAPATGIIQRVKVWVGTAPSGGTALFDVNINGTSIWNADQSQRITIPDGGTSHERTGLTSAITKDDLIAVDFDGFTGGATGIGTFVQITIEMEPGAASDNSLWIQSEADFVPVSPHADNDEFDSSSLDAKWTQNTTGGSNGTVSIDTLIQSHYVTTFTGNGQGHNIEQATTITGDMSLTAKCRAALHANGGGIFMYLRDSADNNRVGIGYLYSTGVFNLNTRKKAAGVWSFNVEDISIGRIEQLYIHLQRASNVWSFWYSYDGLIWHRTTTTVALTFTLSHIMLQMDGPTTLAHNERMAFDWLRANWLTL